VGVKITINDQVLECNEGESVLEVALRHDIDIPHICYHPLLPANGACRMCLVEIDGLRGYPSSCSTPAADGMVVRTETAAVRDRRRENLELILIEHPSSCLVCYKREACQTFRPEKEKTGQTTGCQNCPNKHDCEVQRLTLDLGVTDLPVGSYYRNVDTEAVDPFIENDPNLCILCGRCEQICQLHHGTPVIVLTERGPDARVSQAFGRPLNQSGCTFCGACVDLCPTGSLSDRFAKWYGVPDGLTQTTCSFCDAACALQVSSEGHRVFAAVAIDQTKPLCALGRFAMPPFLASRERLSRPKITVGERLREVTWEEALPAVADLLEPHKGDAFALICDRSGTVEDREAFRAFTTGIMQSAHYLEIADGEAPAVDLPAGVKAVLTAGDFLDSASLEVLETIIVLDAFPSAASERAAAILPAALLLEIAGHLLDENDLERPLKRAVRPAGQARQDREIICGLMAAMGDKAGAEKLAAELESRITESKAELLTERETAPAQALDVTKIRTRHRGHLIADRIPDAGEVQPAATPVSSEVA